MIVNLDNYRRKVATIYVTAPQTSVVTATKDNFIINGVWSASQNKWVIEVYGYGNWNVTCVQGSQSKSTTINVSEYGGVYNTSFSFSYSLTLVKMTQQNRLGYQGVEFNNTRYAKTSSADPTTTHQNVTDIVLNYSLVNVSNFAVVENGVTIHTFNGRDFSYNYTLKGNTTIRVEYTSARVSTWFITYT